MANKKYDDPADAKEARRTCNRIAQQKYRRKQKELKRTSQPSPSNSTARSEMDEETLTGTLPPDASMHAASNEVENVEDERRRPDPASAPLAPLEHIASIEQSVDALLVSVNDPCVQKSLQDPIKRIDLKYRDLHSRIQRTETTHMHRDTRINPTIQYSPYELATSRSGARDMTVETIQSLTQEVYRSRIQHSPLAQIKLLSAELDRVNKQLVGTV